MPTERNGAGSRETADLVVAGAGVIGLACAWRAAASGLDTLVLDAGATERASEVAAGMIAPVGEAVWGEEPLLAAAAASAEAWPAFAAELQAAAGCEVPYRRCGALHVGLDRDEAAELRRRRDLHGELGLPATWLRGSECRRLEPGLATAVAGGFDAPGEAEVDPRPLLVALRAAAAAAGARIEEGMAAVRVVVTAGRVAGVELADGRTVDTPRLLAATGARMGGELLPPDVRPPIRPLKGEILRLRAPPGERPCERIVVTERVYVVPRAGGEVVVGASVEERGFDLRVRAGSVHELLREAYRALPDVAELELVECAAGLRPTTPDNAPVIGPTAIDGLLLAGGHHRNGILLAPITAEAIALELAGAQLPEVIEPLRAERFSRPLQEMGA
ncbi:MAG: glycine oxidase ThiO [Solirubrobacterales bacterium]|nr:glycine oxidase ThiO [Solirubrobacterales bacterium]